MAIYESIKEVANIIQKSDNIDLYKMVLDVQKESMDLLEENRELKQEINKLKELDKIRERLKYKKEGYYIYIDEHGEESEYCAKCWDVNSILVHIYDSVNFNKDVKICPNCKHSVTIRTSSIKL